MNYKLTCHHSNHYFTIVYATLGEAIDKEAYWRQKGYYTSIDKTYAEVT